MEPLFVEQKPQFKKVGAEAQMPINDAEWPAAILEELYKQAPYIGEGYQTEVRISEKDPELGYSIGRIVVYPTTTLPQRSALSEEGRQRGNKVVNIPFMVRQFRLAPLDLMITETGEFRPQTRTRIRDALFKPQVAEGVAKAPATTLFDINTYPTGRGGLYGGSGGMNAAVIPWDKLSSVRSILSSLIADDPTVGEELAAKLKPDWAALDKNAALCRVISRAAQVEKTSRESARREVKLAEKVPAVVHQIIRLPGAVYRVKRANPNAYEPVEKELDRAQALEELGADAVRAADESGLVTISTDAVVREDLVEERIAPITEFGVWRVKAKGDGRQLVGWVFPKVIALDGTMLPVVIFNNGSENSIQKSIAGVRSGTAMDLIDERPSGVGMFYRVTGSDALAVFPLVVTLTAVEPDQTRVCQARTLDGRDVVLKFVRGLKGISSEEDESGRTTYLFPDDMKWMPLPNEGNVDLVEDADQWVKLSHLRKHGTHLTIRYLGDDLYTLSGCGLEKLSEKERSRIRPEDALFLATVVGMHPTFAAQKLARARVMRTVTVPNLRTLTPLSERLAVEEVKVAARLPLSWTTRVPKPVWIIKEAASFMDDPESLDHVLSLGFINPRNIAIFLSHIPDIERTQGKICEVLFASRIANDRDLEAAAEQAMHGVENVLAGLRNLQLEVQEASA